MKLNAATRTRVLADITTDIDPAGAAVEIKIGATWHPATWLGTATTATVREGTAPPRTVWRQTARTTGYFAGPDAVASGATVLALGRHLTKTRVTAEGDILVADSTPIDVR